MARERVRQIRMERGFPDCQINCHNPLSAQFEKWLIDNRASIEGKLAREAADSCPIELPLERKFQIMRKSEIPFMWSIHRKTEALTLPINWELPNTILDAVWNKHKNWAAQKRMDYSRVPIKWRHQIKGVCPVSAKELISRFPDLKEAAQQEIQKAVSLGRVPRWDALSDLGIEQKV